MKKNLFLFILIAVFLKVNAQTEQIRKKHFNINSKGLALQGYDPITYFTSETPKKGNKENNYNYKGITYYFSSSSTLALFKSNPEKWEPAYGGWCAYAMGSSGEKVEIDPETFKIVDGKLCLFYNAYFNNTLPKWNKDEKKLKLQADKNWLIIQTK
jgi:YHS domain-containing protein